MDVGRQRDDHDEDDALQLWIYAANCYINDTGDQPHVSAEQRQRALDERHRQEQLYARIVLQTMNAESDRLIAAITECRARAADRETDGTDGSYGRAADLGELALAVVRESGADSRPAAREQLVRRINEELAGPATPPWRRRFDQARTNSRWLRKPRRLHPAWRRRRRQLVEVDLRRSPAATSGELSVVNAFLDQTRIGRIGYSVCPDCRRAIVYKVEAFYPYEGVGVGTTLVDAAVADGRPQDGYTWYTTGQFDDAVGFWRAMSHRHRTPFTAPAKDATCPHMDIRHTRDW